MPYGEVPIPCSHGITFFRFVGFYDSIKTWRNRIGSINLEISSSFKLLLFTKNCKVFLDFTSKCRCWISVRYYRFSDFFFYFSYGIFVVKNYKTGALIVRINFKNCPLRPVLCSNVEMLLILKFMLLEIALLIFCRNNSAFSRIFGLSSSKQQV